MSRDILEAMRIRRASPGTRRAAARGLAVTALICGLAAPTAAAEPAEAADAASWRGRYCTPTGCGGSASAPWSGTLAFAATTLAAGWIARRRPPAPA